MLFTALLEKQWGTPKGIILIFKCIWLESFSFARGFAREQLRPSEAVNESPARRQGVEMRAGRDLFKPQVTHRIKRPKIGSGEQNKN